MGTVYKRGDSSVWWIGFRNAEGAWEYRSTGVKDERLARRALEQVETAIARQERIAKRPTTVNTWAETWANTRKDVTWTAAQDYGRIKRHVLPRFGASLLVEVEQRQVRTFFQGLRDADELAPRTIRNIFWAMSRLFSDAVAEGLLEKNPCMLEHGDRPVIRDKDRRWRRTAVFTRAEVERLCTDPTLTEHNRVVWALGLLGGLRLGEVAALRWRDIDSSRTPLPGLVISSSYTRINGEEKGTKTDVVREVPVHPALLSILEGWKTAGWKAMFGREPKDGDLVVPNKAGRHLTDNNVHVIRQNNFAALELRSRRFHDARRTFISLARDDGARVDVLKLVTHGAPQTVIDLYTTPAWGTLCAAVQSLKLNFRRGGTRRITTARPTVAVNGGTTMDTDSTTPLAQGGIRSLTDSLVSARDRNLSADERGVNDGERDGRAEDRRNVVSLAHLHGAYGSRR